MSATEPNGQSRRAGRIRAAGISGLCAPVVWAVVAVIEISHANVGHSLISRPERFFSDSDWHWPLVLAVGLLVATEFAAGLGLVAAGRDRWRGPAGVTAVLMALAAAARLGMALLLPSDPHGYTVGVPAALAADTTLLVLPLALMLAAVVVRRSVPVLAWLSAATAVAAIALALWASVWAARSAASQPQLLAIEPVELLAALWSAAAGAWLFGWPAPLGSSRRGPQVPAPGRKAALAIALLAIAAVVVPSVSFVQTYSTAIAAQLTGQTKVETIHADSVDRTYRVYRPSREIARPGLVIVLHGSFGGGFQAETSTGFDVEADRLGWVAVYPDGVADGWDAFGSGPTWGSHPGADDVTFIRTLIDHFEATDEVDPNRVYVTGHSRGGMATYFLGCKLSGIVAAIAPVSGNMATASGSADVPCSLASPVSVLAIHGTSDGTIPMEGGKVDIVFSPMADVIARWRVMDNCSAPAATSVEGINTTTSWTCAGAVEVVTRIVAGGCHCWPGDASRVIADFFVAHPRAAPAG